MLVDGADAQLEGGPRRADADVAAVDPDGARVRRTMPARMPIRVDFPAPFSPSRQWTSPRRSANVMSSLARTPGKDLLMPSSSTAGV